MYANDLALVASTPKELQAMLDVVERYASRWRYSLNADKSVVMILGESSRTRSLARSTRKWTLGAESIKEVDEQHHLGILCTVHSTNIFCTIERCTSGWSAFFALSSIGSRFGCLHPLTSFRLYNTLCMPILLYGAELWTLTKVELTMLVHCWSECTGRFAHNYGSACPLSFLLPNIYTWIQRIQTRITQRKLNFINSITL